MHSILKRIFRKKIRGNRENHRWYGNTYWSFDRTERQRNTLLYNRDCYVIIALLQQKFKTCTQLCSRSQPKFFLGGGMFVTPLLKAQND